MIKNSHEDTQKELSLKEKLKLPSYKWSWPFFFKSLFWLAILLFILDIASKWLVVNLVGTKGPDGLVHGGTVSVIDGFFNIHLVFNEGMAFGLGDGNLAFRILFIIISILAVIIIPYFWYKHLDKKSVLLNLVFSLCWSGALGNLIDRAFYFKEIVGFSGVVDFFEFYIFGPNSQPFAVFNIADACLTIGLVLAVIYLLISLYKEHKQEGK